ncbi:MAG: hypothetical protein P1Q69_15850 [Candidatus Thorarchaeota archaeon]|nr:hypothetical protein [Candidatus Thorarchaeota archaeon]
MDLEGKHIIIPASATKHLDLSGGPPMVQAVPEDYVLSANVMMLLDESCGDDIEFIMKTYLPIRILHMPMGSNCVFIEMLGLSSTTVKLAPADIIDNLIEELESSNKTETLTDSVTRFGKFLENIAQIKNTPQIGILPNSQAEPLLELMQWPRQSDIEPYSLALPTVMDERKFKAMANAIRDSYECLNNIQDKIRRFDDILDEKIVKIDRQSSSAVSDRLKRLQDRISTLEEEIQYLESRMEQFSSKDGNSSESKKRMAEIDSSLKARRKALERDCERKDKFEAQTVGQTKILRETQHNMRNFIKGIWQMVERIIHQHFQIIARCSSTSSHSESTLMLPILVAGLSRKGQLRVRLIPPLLLDDVTERVSMRRDFVYPFTEVTSVKDLVQSLTKRANSDITFRKTLRSESQEKNILSLEPTRKTLLDGAKLLLADGLVKESGVEDLKELLSRIPVQKIKISKKGDGTIPAIPTDGSICQVVFNVHNDAGSPIIGAELELGALLLESDKSGRIEISLPPSNYEGIINAVGYHPKQFDFTLNSPGVIAVPIVLSALSREDKLNEELDSLIEKAKRLDTVRTRLNEAFESHGDTLLQIPAYRTILIELLTDLGLEPESWIAEATKKRGMMKRLLKRDERQERIRRDILRLAEESKQTGGIMLLSELLVRLDDRGWETAIEDIEGLLKDMIKEGLLEGITNLEHGTRLVKFIPVALTDDPQRILALASRNDGRLTIEESVIELGWTEERVRNALDLLLANGVAKIQRSFSRSTQYWFPGLKGRKN